MEMVYSSAGHNPMLYYSAKEDKVSLLKTGPDFPLRTFETEQYEEKSMQMNPFDKILLFTDGVLDVQNPEMDFYGQERLEKIFKDNHAVTSEELVDRIVQDTEFFRRGKRRLDDFTLLVIGCR